MLTKLDMRIDIMESCIFFYYYFFGIIGPLWNLWRWSSVQVYARGRKQCCKLHYCLWRVSINPRLPFSLSVMCFLLPRAIFLTFILIAHWQIAWIYSSYLPAACLLFHAFIKKSVPRMRLVCLSNKIVSALLRRFMTVWKYIYFVFIQLFHKSSIITYLISSFI